MMKHCRNISEDNMKVTKRQLRQIIAEALEGDPNQQEAAYAVIYTEGYVQQFTEIFSKTLNSNQELARTKAENWIPLSDALGDIGATLVAGVRDIKTQNPDLDLSEESNVAAEGADAAKFDFASDIFKCIEQIDALVNQQTPMGMSAAEGLGVFGHEAGGASYQNTASSDAAALVSLLDNDDVLIFLDEVENMRAYGELR